MEIKREFLETLVRISEACSKDETRPQLSGINMRRLKDNKVILEACDGYILIRETIEDEELYKLLKESVIVDVNGLKQFVTKHRTLSYFTLTLDDIFIDITVNNRLETPIRLPLINREYVKTDTVKTYYDDKDTHEIVVDAELLMRITKAMNGHKKRDNKIVKLIVKDAYSPVSIKSKTANQEAVIMPCRGL